MSEFAAGAVMVLIVIGIVLALVAVLQSRED